MAMASLDDFQAPLASFPETPCNVRVTPSIASSTVLLELVTACPSSVSFASWAARSSVRFVMAGDVSLGR